MQIEISFTCRECEQENTLRTDTANFGSIEESWDTNGMPIPNVERALALELRCSCGHVSGQIGLGYGYFKQHRPSFDPARPY